MAGIQNYPTTADQVHGTTLTPLLIDMSHWDFHTLSDQFDLHVDALGAQLLQMSSSYDPYSYISLPGPPYWMSMNISGNGFGSPDAEGFPTTGQVNGLDMVDPVQKLQLYIQDLDLPVGQVLAAYREGRTGDLVAMLTGGNDRIEGGNYDLSDVLGTKMGDVISGGAGNDTILGHGGRDTLQGGAGDDLFSTVDHTTAAAALGDHAQIDGGSGANTVSYANAPFAVTVDLSDPAHSQDTLVNIQGVVGSAFGDLLSGSAGDDTLSTGGGPDTVKGGAGDDVLIATGDGFPTGADSAAPHNVLFGGDGDDLVRGDTGFNQINGNAGNDTIIGKSLTGDWLLGGQGSDVIDATTALGHNIVNGNLGNDTVTGGRNGDTLRGGQGDDVITGGGFAGGPGDLIFGDLGHNTITGGAGADTFAAGAGHDVVTDFTINEHDHVLVAQGVTWQAAQSGADALVTLSNGGDMLLRNVQLDSLGASWIGTS